MKNKLELNLVAKEDGKSLMQVRVNANGRELTAIILGLIDNLAEDFTKNPLEKAVFLKSVHDAMANLILKTLLDT